MNWVGHSPTLGIVTAAFTHLGGRTLDDTVKMIQDELQDRYPRNGLAGVARAAYNEAP